MRVFLIAVLATVILAVGSIFALNTAQRTAAAAYTTEGARINPAWRTASGDRAQPAASPCILRPSRRPTRSRANGAGWSSAQSIKAK